LMMAMDATIVVEGPEGRRTVPITEFFHGFYMTALEPSEVLVEIQVPAAKENSGGAYYKMERKVGDYATSGAAVYLEMDGNICSKVGIGLTNVSAVPIKLERAEELLTGKELTAELIEQAGTIASEDCEPESDLRGSEAYKRSVTKTITMRMLNKALERAKS
ncbi:MAG: FAD binding domain-containing protein, partial [Eudoraea sp.]|nr:FAD binding domain-containing protein [Eudoraea sp.]